MSQAHSRQYNHRATMNTHPRIHYSNSIYINSSNNNIATKSNRGSNQYSSSKLEYLFTVQEGWRKLKPNPFVKYLLAGSV